ncbi:OmpH family outer membrane protein [Pseudodesulfovibrio sediminis]|uniref:Outer membrane chaperone Skp (OmpH) n=1 Tax=Pseudodesulfovibrio sediminis TaxID=2810563 RepID=A0ABM8HY34_9BACT|nr:OmpH family outer membrane protein [Pseudodesulfovibrio sediminis]BCS88716.1 hypothetical protein PSDVSF_19580 [Pseudodesulfovibrio sediminis]
MKRIIPLLTALALCLVLIAGCNQQEPGVKIGIVDEAAAFKDNQVAKKAMDYLKEVGTPLQTKAEAAYKAMQANQTEETVAAYKAAMGELQNTMNQEQQRVVALVEAKFNDVLNTYRSEKGLTVILSKQSVISMSDAVDITADIVAAMDAVDLEITPAAPAEEAVETPAEAPAETPAEAPAETPAEAPTDAE